MKYVLLALYQYWLRARMWWRRFYTKTTDEVDFCNKVSCTVKTLFRTHLYQCKSQTLKVASQMCSTGHNNVVVTSVHFWLNKLSSPAVCPILWSTYLALGPGLDTSLAARSKREQALRQTVESCQKLWEERTNRIWSTYIRQWSSNHTFHRSCLLPLFFPSSRSLHLSLNRCRSTYVYHNNAALIE